MMRDQFLNELHTGHLGITKCIELAKQTMYWPGINNDIEQFMATCQPCLKYAASNKNHPEKKEPARARNSSNTMDQVRHRYIHTGWSQLPACGQLHIKVSHHVKADIHDWKSSGKPLQEPNE